MLAKNIIVLLLLLEKFKEIKKNETLKGSTTTYNKETNICRPKK